MYSEDFSTEEDKGWLNNAYTAPANGKLGLTVVGSPDLTGVYKDHVYYYGELRK